MSNPVYDAKRTGLLLVDPYNDFLSDGGKVFPMIRDIAAEVRLFDNLRAAVGTARKTDIQVFYVAHRRWQPGDYDNWDHPNPTQRLLQQRHTFAAERGVVNGIPTLCRRKATSSFRNTGGRAALLTTISTSSSNSKA
jgi:hypothetical protein